MGELPFSVMLPGFFYCDSGGWCFLCSLACVPLSDSHVDFSRLLQVQSAIFYLWRLCCRHSYYSYVYCREIVCELNSANKLTALVASLYLPTPLL